MVVFGRAEVWRRASRVSRGWGLGWGWIHHMELQILCSILNALLCKEAVKGKDFILLFVQEKSEE